MGYIHPYQSNRFVSAALIIDHLSTNAFTNVQFLGALHKYCVKRFMHFELYAAWERAKGCLFQTHIVYKKDLAEKQHKRDCTYKEVLLSDSEKVYLFRGREGISEFLQKNLLSMTGK